MIVFAYCCILPWFQNRTYFYFLIAGIIKDVNGKFRGGARLAAEFLKDNHKILTFLFGWRLGKLVWSTGILHIFLPLMSGRGCSIKFEFYNHIFLLLSIVGEGSNSGQKLLNIRLQLFRCAFQNIPVQFLIFVSSVSVLRLKSLLSANLNESCILQLVFEVPGKSHWYIFQSCLSELIIEGVIFRKPASVWN